MFWCYWFFTFFYYFIFIVEDPNEAFTILFDSIDILRLQKLDIYSPNIKNATDIYYLLKNDAINLKITNVIKYFYYILIRNV